MSEQPILKIINPSDVVAVFSADSNYEITKVMVQLMQYNKDGIATMSMFDGPTLHEGDSVMMILERNKLEDAE